MLNIVSFSGGKDSTAMLLKMIEKGQPIDLIVSVDTTKEFPHLWDRLKKMDALSYRKFRNDYSVNELEDKFKKESR